MGFFKELKNDLSQAVNELLPEDTSDQKQTDSEEMVNTLDTNEEADKARMMEWLEEFVQEDADKQEPLETQSILQEESLEGSLLQEDLSVEDEEEINQDIVVEDTNEIKEKEDETMEDNVDLELFNALNESDLEVAQVSEKEAPKQKSTAVADDEVTVIAKGTTINGSISSDGSLDILGTVNGDVECLGKLSVTGKVKGNASAAEVYVNTDRIEGSIISEGSVKVGLGTVVLGDITATSGVIAGAIKGEIDVNGPIVIDSTAIIKGNIKAKSVQINNGAVIEGFCSLSYSSIDVDNIFE